MSLFDLICPPSFAHDGSVPITVSASVWWEWKTEWVLLALLLTVAVLYVRLGRYTAVQQGQTLLAKHVALFMSGLALMYIAIASPIDRVGEEYLFSVHMVQHNLMMYLLPRLLLSGIPEWMFAYWFDSSKLFKRIYKICSQPALACLAFNLVFTLWHIPFLYDWALRDRLVHNIEHLTMIGTALMLWLPLWTPLKSERLSYPMQMFYLIAIAIAQIPVFAYVTFSPVVLYPTYEMAPRLTVMSAAMDQQLGGVLMKINGMLVLFGAFISVAMQWYNSEQSPVSQRAENPEIPLTKAVQSTT